MYFLPSRLMAVSGSRSPATGTGRPIKPETRINQCNFIFPYLRFITILTAKRNMKESLLFLTLVLFTCINGFAQHQVSGTVTDARDGLPLPGATIKVKGSLLSVATDSGGRYNISVPGNSILIFSSIG